MKKSIRNSLSVIIIIGMLTALALNYYLEVHMCHQETNNSTQAMFGQIEHILAENALELENTTAEFSSRCLTKAHVAAHLIQDLDEAGEQHPLPAQKLYDISKLLDIDELNLFNSDGILYNGTHPEYFGLSMNSGEQVSYFLPMLEDTSLSLSQDITPNTATGKMMMYAVVWREDKKELIQVGIEAERIRSITEKNELSHIFSVFSDKKGSDLYAVDPISYEILGSTNDALVGSTLDEIGFRTETLLLNGIGFRQKLNTGHHYCIFVNQDDIILGRTISSRTLYADLNRTTALLILYLVLITIAMCLMIYRYLDKNIIHSIYTVNNHLQKISDGNLDNPVHIDTTPEFMELSNHINEMQNKLAASRKQLEFERDIDMTTGLYNRRAYYSQLDMMFAMPETLGFCAIFVIDADNLKSVNDTYGHGLGDYYLASIAETLNSIPIPLKITARLSGDEFSLFLYGYKDRDALIKDIQQIQKISEGFYISARHDLQLFVSFSAGTALYKEDGDDFHQLLKCADKRMYQEKKARKSQQNHQ